MQRTFVVLSLAAALVVPGCVKKSESPEDSAAPAASGAAEITESDVDAVLADVPVPTEEEAAEQAAASIDAQNADAEYERLKAEIEGDPDG